MISSIDSSMASQLASSLFSKLDTQNKGYLEKSNFQSALGSASNDSDNTTEVDDVFEQLDGNGDGKVTEAEVSSVLANILSKNQNSAGIGQGPGGPGGPGGPPPPPQGEDTGFTKEELSSQLEEIGSSDDKRASVISNVVNNFEAADANQDGKVTAAEAMAYEQKNSVDSSSSSQSSAKTSANSTDTNNQANNDEIVQQVMKLLSAYKNQEAGAYASANSTSLSVMA
jgi:Ca2+-binding EF-hand superfamily protein